ncbi:hypothetical protein VB834_26645 [Limnoraphis robusta Tam1]|uniref:Uncharacterized protein n=1 Tax=Limnoraphis robusta CCNP1315 TaxID=3110306 RepID=A0ABU5TWU2_9CYAN|nr:hypothetical protein [Limnoraphis robusta]MEA5500786.1 hypothetical protein [Limnoraphis robusta BA-68 BA1]MEA5519265.1 hypothetical protein [Limnoraphis robusta CCNP1315]MEA5542614.1 hypothetical protein [Limnoraphis robusta Tam1]MEA5547134.1 hypothetical protein [Limnoraphis robusta CCNP1324]
MLDISTLSLAQSAISLLPIILAQDTVPTIPDTSIPQTEVNPASIISGLIGYLIGAFFCWKIYQKCGVEKAWFAWIPILGIYIHFVAGDQDNPILWTILVFIPCINIIAIIWGIKAWIKICQKLEKSPWLLLLWLIPCLGTLIFYANLAFY